jgi:pyridoxal phosphate enzyme (YggS family)
MDLISNYRDLCNDVNNVASRSGRNPEEITIIAVSKTFPAATLQQAIDHGITILGENKVQEAKSKSETLQGTYSLHMIGHLQSNKAKEAVKLFDCIHSIDKFSTAQKINNAAREAEKIQKILIQVNTSGEETKSGVSKNNLLNISGEIADLDNVEILGLMTMAPHTDDETIIRDTFKKTRDLLNEVNVKHGFNLTDLSMGMSSDYRIAIEEGATMIRVGSLIFGKRNYT